MKTVFRLLSAASILLLASCAADFGETPPSDTPDSGMPSTFPGGGPPPVI